MEAGLKEIWVSPDNEYKLYVFEDAMQVPTLRHLTADAAVNQASLKMSKAELERLLHGITIHFNSGEITKAAAIIEEMKYRLTFPAEEVTMLDIAFCYTLVNDEAKDKQSAKDKALKLKLIEQYPETKDFFLLTAHAIMQNFAKFSQDDMFASFKEIQTRQHYVASLLRK
jgi:hypothetical protein